MTNLYCDAEGRIVDVDRGTTALLGWSRADVVDARLADYLHPESEASFEQGWDQLVATEGASRNVDVRLRRGDGTWVSVAITDVNRLGDQGLHAIQSSVALLDAPSSLAPAVSPPPARAFAPPPLNPPAPAGWTSRTISRRLALLGILGLAAVLRLWDLSGLPVLLHGDEALSGLDAQRILDEGWIGVYTPSALGQPAMPFYAMALTVAGFGPTTFAIRVVSALVGVLTVYVLYRVVAPRFGVRVALLASLVLAVLNWHIHFTRLAFGVAWWPLALLLGVGAVDRALRRDNATSPAGPGDSGPAVLGTPKASFVSWFVAGLMTALGVYVYNAHWSAAAGVFLFVAAMTVHRLIAGSARGAFGRLTAFALGLGITLIPMARTMLGDGYFNHFREFSYRSTDEWTGASTAGKAGLFVERYITSVSRIFVQPLVDGADGSGVIRPVPLVFGLAFVLGIGVLLRRHRHALTGLVLLLCALLPVGVALTVDGHLRRDSAMAPLVALVAAVGLSWLWDRLPVGDLGPAGLVRGSIVVGLVLVVGALSASAYFGTFRNDQSHQWTFGGELAGPIELMHEYGDEAEINLFSRRHSIGYESIRFLAPNIVGRDRFEPFVENESIEPADDASGPQLFVLVHPGDELIAAIVERYPNAQLVADDESGGIPYQGYLIE